LSAALSEELPKRSIGATLAKAVADARERVPAEEMARYDAWATHHPGLMGTGVEKLLEPARRVSRFSFRY
jgi:hypothetical protein